MSSFPARAALVAALLLPWPALAQTAPKPAAPTKEQVAQWVKDLGGDDFAVREAASKKLWEAGEAAEAAVLEATKSGDAEVARRAGELAEKFRWGIFPDTPQKVLDLIARYQTGDENGKLAVVREMFEAGPPGCATLLKIAGAEKDANFRKRLLSQIGQEATRAVPSLLAAGNLTHLETLLELGVAADADNATPGYAAYWMLRGGLDGKIAHWKAESAKPDNKRASEVLAYLYRAGGDLPAARAAAEKAGRADLIEQILYEQGDWKALAGRPAANDYRREIEALGYKAAYHRLAGDRDGFDKALAAVRKFAAGRTEGDAEVWYAAKALFLNDRAAEALGLLKKVDRYPEVRFEVLAAQGRYREAFEVADAVKDADPQKPLLEVLRARALYDLGEKDRATAIFAKLAEGIKAGNEAPWEGRLIDVEYRLGLHEQSREHCARLLRLLTASQGTARAARLLGKVFPGHGDEAAVLWTSLRRAPAKADGHPDMMKQLRDLFDGRLTEKEILALAAAAEKWEGRPAPEDREARLLALAAAASAAKHDALATRFLEKAAAQGSAVPLLRLGDLLAGQKKWEKAAEQYAAAWERNRGDPLPLYLRGHALAQAGKEKDGKLWLDRAHLLPLGNESVRRAFADALARRGFAEAARRERATLIKVSAPGSFYAGDALRQLALAAAARHEDLKAAEMQEKAMLRCLDVRISFLESAAYVRVPHAVHRLRLRGLLAANRTDEALKELALCEASLPGDVEVAIAAAPALEKAGRKKDADEAFARCFALHEQLAKDHPGSAREHNSLAWLSACCRRELDKGLEHAQKGVDLAPDDARYYDTLGEVLFQRGDKEKALAAARKSAELDPKTGYYKRQVKRVEAGDPKAPLPPQGDEQ